MNKIKSSQSTSATSSVSRRAVLIGGTAATGLLAAKMFPASIVAPAIAQSGRPNFTHGVQSGDISADGGMIWARADRAARLMVEVSTTESFKNAQLLRGPAAIEAGDFTAKMALQGLPADQDIFYRLQWHDLDNVNSVSEPMVGRMRTAPASKRNITFVWSGDTCGQGWGINEAWGGMRGYETMRGNNPDFFIHSGDTIYADGPIPAEQKLPDGSIWRNLVTEETSKVAETLAEFRGNYKYNLLDENVRRFNAEVPMLAQWDDHEVVNNWYPGETLESDDRYSVKSASLLFARGARAFHEYMPLRTSPNEPERIYRKIAYGPSLDIFFLDMRSYRGPNGANNQTEPSAETAFLGARQLRWLKRELLASNATWKVIASDMPIGLVVADGETAFENLANGDGPALGRELETARLLSFIKHSEIKNVVWVTADVHYTAAHYYDPAKAQFTDFAPFWEFVSGPLNAGTFGPNKLDNTFGPQLMYVKAPAEGQVNLPPSAGMQFFGDVQIDGKTGVMTVVLRDLESAELYRQELAPQYV